MLSLSKILIPIDFSERCLRAATYAIPLAERFRSVVTLLHIGSDHRSEPNGNTQNIVEAQIKLRGFLRAEFNHLNVKRELRFGDPAAEIVAYASSQRPDLIMMPTHGYGQFRRRLLGSVTMKVLHDVDCPVWTGAHLSGWVSTESIVPKKILCAIDVNHSGEEILAWASELASSLEADIEIVYAEPRFESFGEEYYSSKFYFRIMAAASQKAEEMQQRSGTHAQVHIEPGHISDAVVKTAERLHADLVVIGRGSTMAAGRFGLNTYGIIRYSKCPVISVPSDDSAARSPIHRRVQVRQPDGGFHQTDPRWSPMAHPARPPLQDASRRSRPGLSNTRNQQNSLPEK